MHTLELEERRARMRRFLRIGTAAWAVFLFTDAFAARALGVPIEVLVGLRIAGAAVGLAAYGLAKHKDLSERALTTIEAAVFVAAGLLVSIGAILSGGLRSPLAQGVVIVTLFRTVLPAPWVRALPIALGCALTFPTALLIGAAFDPALAAHLASDRWSLGLSTMFLVLTAALASVGSHMQWDARKQVHEARRLGAYRLVARIAAGGMGEVWLARQVALNRNVALKILKERILTEAGALRRFQREAEAASTLTHPNTIRVFDFGASDDGVFFLAMELLDGLDLEDLVERVGPLPPGRVIHLARQACASLAEAHHRGLVHCDVKPANLFVAKLGDELDFVKVLDFGLVRVMSGPGATTIDAIRGTPTFMPPEVVRGEPVGPESDVYSMGAVLYFILTGTTVFQTSSYHESLLAHLETEIEPPSRRLGTKVPADLEAVVMKCLSKKRGDRYVTAREVEAALAACTDAASWTQEHARASWALLRPSMASIRTAPGRGRVKGRAPADGA